MYSVAVPKSRADPILGVHRWYLYCMRRTREDACPMIGDQHLVPQSQTQGAMAADSYQDA